MIDILIFVTYLLVLIGIALKSRAESKASDFSTQFLAKKDLGLWESLFSVTATEVSALTFLAVPAFAFRSNLSFFQIYLGAVVARFLIAYWILPKIYNQGSTFLEILESKNERARKGLVGFYFLHMWPAVGVRLYTGSILIAAFFEVNIAVAVIATALLTFTYTQIGGLKSVVRTDIFQMLLFIFSGFLVHYMVADISQTPWIEMMREAAANSKLLLYSPNALSSFFIGMMGGALFDLCTHGADQNFAQRLIACKTEALARKSILLSSITTLGIGMLFLTIGSLLWVFYEGKAPEGVFSDHILAHFIMNYFPDGLKGLMVAAALASTMSTLDSTINAMAASVVNDFQKNLSNKRGHFFKVSFIITLGFIAIALISMKSGEILIFGLKISTVIIGPMLSLFIVKKALKWINEYSLTDIVLSNLCGMALAFANLFVLKWNWNFTIAFGIIGGLLPLVLKALVLKKEA